MMLEGVGVKHWSRTQRTRALSAGEAEYYAVVTGCAEGLGAKPLMEDMGYELDVSIWTDSDAGRSIASRRGLGKVRHLELRYLWVQDVVKERRLKMRRVDGERNVADHLTKPKNKNDMKVKIGDAGGVLVDKEVALPMDQMGTR